MTSSQISQWLLKHDAPFTEEDKNALALLSKTYPYFVPSKYIEAAAYNAAHPFAPAILNKMRLYMGDWILFHEFLREDRSKKDIENKTSIPTQQDSEEYRDDEPEYFFDTYEDEQEILKVEEQQLPEVSFDEDEEEDFELFNEKDSVEEPFAAFDTRNEKPKVPEKKVPEAKEKGTALPIPETTEEIPHEPDAGKAEEIPHETDDVEEVVQEPVTEENSEATPEETVPVEIIAHEERKSHKAKSEPLIQPIYTEDYFLHQGIEAEETAKAEEEKQLMVMMSFSDWLMHFKTKKEKQKEEEEDQKALKTMWQKEKLAAALEEENEEIPEGVFEMAVNSIKNEEDLVSESLAEIMIKQGKLDKAIEMYRKLSLRNPQKNAYFADKIEKLIKEK